MVEKDIEYYKNKYQERADRCRYLDRELAHAKYLYRKYVEKEERLGFSDKTKHRDMELIAATILAAHELQRQGVLVYNEFAILLTGYYADVFYMSDVMRRCGRNDAGIRMDIATCLEAGMIKRVPRSKWLHITLAGKDRIESILEYIYAKKKTSTRLLRKRGKNPDGPGAITPYWKDVTQIIKQKGEARFHEYMSYRRWKRMGWPKPEGFPGEDPQEANVTWIDEPEDDLNIDAPEGGESETSQESGTIN